MSDWSVPKSIRPELISELSCLVWVNVNRAAKITAITPRHKCPHLNTDDNHEEEAIESISGDQTTFVGLLTSK